MEVERKCGRQQHQPGTPVKRSGCGGGQRECASKEKCHRNRDAEELSSGQQKCYYIINIISGNGRPGKSQTGHQALFAGIECQAD